MANELFRSFLTVAIAALIFYFVQQPGSVLNKQKTNEEIRKDRARLLIDVARIEDKQEREIALKILSHAYSGHADAFFEEAEALIEVKTKSDILKQDIEKIKIYDTDACLKYVERVKELHREVDNLQLKATLEEKTGTGIDDGRPRVVGRGPVYKNLIGLKYAREVEAAALTDLVNRRCK